MQTLARMYSKYVDKSEPYLVECFTRKLQAGSVVKSSLVLFFFSNLARKV